MQKSVLRRRSKTYWFGGLVTAAGVWNVLAAVLPAIAAIPGVSPLWAVLGAAILALREKTEAPLAPIARDRNPICMGLAACALALVAPACQSSGGGSGVGVVASFTIGVPGEKPAALMRWDADTIVAWGNVQAMFEVYVEATGLPLYLYPLAEDQAFVHVTSSKFTWTGGLSDPLPREAMGRFRAAEIAAWGLSFQPEPPPAPPPVPPPSP